MKRVLICGANGLVGQRVSHLLSHDTSCETLNTSARRSFVLDHKLFDYTQLDITSRGDVRSLAASFQPTVIINCAARPDPDWCELNREEAWKINVIGVENLCDAARKARAHLIHISSDYIFDGNPKHPYVETDLPNPINYYGKTKLAAENAIHSALIRSTLLRSTLIYGNSIGTKLGIVQKIRNAVAAHEPFRAASDQIGAPVSVKDLAKAIVRVMEMELEGIYNIAGPAPVSRYQLALEVARAFDLNHSTIVPVLLNDLKQIAPRPPVTDLNIAKARRVFGFFPMDIYTGLLDMRLELETVPYLMHRA